MADIATAVRAALVASSVNASATGGIFPDVLPQGCTYPAIRYALADETSYGHLAGKSAFADALISIDCYALTRLAATSLGDLVRIALDRYSGTVSGINIVRAYVQSGVHLFREPADKSDLGAYRAARDYRIFYVENTS